MTVEEMLIAAIGGLVAAVLYLYKQGEDRAKICEKELASLRDKFDALERDYILLAARQSKAITKAD